MSLANKEIYQNGAIREFEKPEVCEAIKVANENRWTVCLSPIEWYEREARLKKEYEKNTKAPGSGEEQSKEGDLKAATKMFGAQAMEIIRLTAENAELRETIDKMKEGNPALKEALNESATQFNDALLDEQTRKIDKQNQEITRLLSLVEKKENSISRLHYEKSVLEKENEELKKGEIPAKYFDKSLVDEQAEKIKKLEHEKLDILEMASSCKQTIDELTKENERLKDQVAVLYAYKEHNENFDRKQIKRLGKEIARLNKIIHKKNLQIEELKEESSEHLDGKVRYNGETVGLSKELFYTNKELRLSKIREKNLTDVCQKYMKENEELKKELDEANKHQQQAYRSCADKNKEIRALKLQISALEKRGNGIDWKRNADAIKLYVNRASHERLWSPISQDICNEQELSFIINHGGKRVKYALRFDGTDIVYECSDPDKKPSFFRDDSVGAVTNQKDCSPVKDTHPTEDNPEEIEIEKAVKLVRKAMKEGRTVTIDYKD